MWRHIPSLCGTLFLFCAVTREQKGKNHIVMIITQGSSSYYRPSLEYSRSLDCCLLGSIVDRRLVLCLLSVPVWSRWQMFVRGYCGSIFLRGRREGELALLHNRRDSGITCPQSLWHASLAIGMGARALSYPSHELRSCGCVIDVGRELTVAGHSQPSSQCSSARSFLNLR